jgi:hypothetical protein
MRKIATKIVFHLIYPFHSDCLKLGLAAEPDFHARSPKIVFSMITKNINLPMLIDGSFERSWSCVHFDHNAYAPLFRRKLKGNEIAKFSKT